MNNRMLFRVDANNEIGRGHLSRMIAIAQMLEQYFEVLFLVSATNKTFCQPLLKSWETLYLQSEDDLHEITSRNDVLWVDGYAFDQKWRLEYQSNVCKLVYIDDLPGNIDGADVILNHCPGISVSDYEQQPGVEFLLGLNYTLLRPAFLEHARNFDDAHISTSGVFICFGGGDPKGLGPRFVGELLNSGFRDPIYFVSTAADQGLEHIQAADNAHVLSGLSENEMIGFMQKSQVVVVPSSNLSFEATALRKPIFTLYYVDNQKLIYHGIQKLQLAYGCGFIDSASEMMKIVPKFTAFYDDLEHQAKLVQNQKSILDGSTAQRLLQCVNRWVEPNH